MFDKLLWPKFFSNIMWHLDEIQITLSFAMACHAAPSLHPCCRTSAIVTVTKNSSTILNKLE